MSELARQFKEYFYYSHFPVSLSNIKYSSSLINGSSGDIFLEGKSSPKYFCSVFASFSQSALAAAITAAILEITHNAPCVGTLFTHALIQAFLFDPNNNQAKWSKFASQSNSILYKIKIHLNKTLQSHILKYIFYAFPALFYVFLKRKAFNFYISWNVPKQYGGKAMPIRRHFSLF